MQRGTDLGDRCKKLDRCWGLNVGVFQRETDLGDRCKLVIYGGFGYTLTSSNS